MPSFNETATRNILSNRRSREKDDEFNIDEGENSEDDEDEILITEGLKAPQVTAALRNIFAAIESSSVSARPQELGVALYRNSSDKKVDKQPLQSVFNAALSSGVQQECSRSTLAQTVIEVVKEWGAELLPNDVLIGIVTIDRLKKEYKKVNKGHLELWSAIIAHLQRVVDVDSSGFSTYSPADLDSIAK